MAYAESIDSFLIFMSFCWLCVSISSNIYFGNTQLKCKLCGMSVRINSWHDGCWMVLWWRKEMSRADLVWLNGTPLWKTGTMETGVYSSIKDTKVFVLTNKSYFRRITKLALNMMNSKFHLYCLTKGSLCNQESYLLKWYNTVKFLYHCHCPFQI